MYSLLMVSLYNKANRSYFINIYVYIIYKRNQRRIEVVSCMNVFMHKFNYMSYLISNLIQGVPRNMTVGE